MILKKDKPRKEGNTWRKQVCPWALKTNYAWAYSENADGVNYKCTCQECKPPKKEK